MGSNSRRQGCRRHGQSSTRSSGTTLSNKAHRESARYSSAAATHGGSSEDESAEVSLKVEVWELRNQVQRLANQQGELEIQLRQERRQSDKLGKRLHKELRLARAKVEQHCEERDSALEQVRSLEQRGESQKQELEELRGRLQALRAKLIAPNKSTSDVQRRRRGRHVQCAKEAARR